MRRHGINAWKQEWLNALVCKYSPRAHEVRAELGRMIGEWSAWQPLHVESPCVLGPSVVKRLRSEKIHVPVLGIYAGYDGGLNNRGINRLLSVIPGSRKVLIKDAGHFSNLDAPDSFNHVLWQFFESVNVSNKFSRKHPLRGLESYKVKVDV